MNTDTTKIYHSSNCNICYEDYEKAQTNECWLLKCGHIFHERCIKTWINVHQNCPSCRSKAFVPNLLKEIVTEIVIQGMEGAKKVGKYIAFIISIIALHIFTHRSLNYFFPGRWPTTKEEIDAYINEHGVIFDLSRPEGFFRLGLSIITPIGIASSYYIIKSLNQRRNRTAEIAQKITYMPPEQ
jgi:hypothetical protein